MINQINIDINVVKDFKVKGTIWEPKNKKAIIVICHGMAEHIKRYDQFAKCSANNNYLVVGYDQRGHGLTAPKLEEIGYMSDDNNITALILDLNEDITFAKRTYPNIPIILFGHSMGSFVSISYIEQFGTNV